MEGLLSFRTSAHNFFAFNVYTKPKLLSYRNHYLKAALRHSCNNVLKYSSVKIMFDEAALE
jgi:hypothetical protein